MPDELVMLETARWLQYTREDLDAAIALQSGTPRHSCLLAQQSAEKAIKSIYVFLDQRVPRSHDLDMLISQLPDGWDIKTRFDDLSELSFWAVESRYPGDAPEATRDDADCAVALAKDVLSCVEKSLQNNGFSL
ncbi:MAG: HEPN domain-containing protein [Armatimonadota bacterium]